ncbi:MAG: hypothetical protein M3273_07275 [Actinomycetota bacterium]|nr:hypothetical protein [Actinomycetota bacterium]
MGPLSLAALLIAGTLLFPPPGEACIPDGDGSYGESPIGRWAAALLVEVGAPGAAVVPKDVSDTGTALEVRAEPYDDGTSVYVIAQRPPDPEFTPDATELVRRHDGFSIYFRATGAWRSFTGLSPEWQLSLISYPGPEGAEIEWAADDPVVAEWLDRALSYAGRNPPPCS